jgi:hypothetical protein
MSSLRNYLGFLVCAALFTGACGGESRPGPLKHHLDDMFIAQIPIAEKQSVIQAQQDYYVAKMERSKAEADLNDAGADLQVAKNQREQAALDEKTAKTRKQNADKSADLNKINAAALLEREAETARRAAEKKVEYMKARREYLKKWVHHAEDLMYAQEARYELSKARLAQSKNIRPRGMVMADYERQAQDRAQYVQRNKPAMDKKKADVDRLRKEWKTLAKQAGIETGGETPIKESGAPKTVRPPDTTPAPPPAKTPDPGKSPGTTGVDSGELGGGGRDVDLGDGGDEQ